jgi:hypothetical protein
MIIISEVNFHRTNEHPSVVGTGEGVPAHLFRKIPVDRDGFINSRNNLSPVKRIRIFQNGIIFAAPQKFLKPIP